MDGLEGLFNVIRIETDQRILTDLGTMNRFRLNFVDVAFAVFLGLRERVCGKKCEQHQQKDCKGKMRYWFHGSAPYHN
jgi:hypothetical protein